jgi:D-3-phosphoglycerate dehydrogenase
LTNSIFPASQRKLEEFCDVVIAPDTKAETLKMLIKDCDGLIVRCQLPVDIFEGADNLKAVVRHGVGLDFIPVIAATGKKIPVANLPGSNTRAVVEYCLAAIFYFRRRLDKINEKLRHDGWNKTRPLADSLTEIQSSTMGILGVGAIGSKISKIALDLGMNVVGFDPALSVEAAWRLPSQVGRMENLQSLLARSDYITLHVPAIPATKNLDESYLEFKHAHAHISILH